MEEKFIYQCCFEYRRLGMSRGTNFQDCLITTSEKILTSEIYEGVRDNLIEGIEEGVQWLVIRNLSYLGRTE